MTDSLMERVIAPDREAVPDEEEVVERFLQDSHRFLDEVDDPLERKVEVLRQAVKEMDRSLSEEEKAFLWTLCGFLSWITDDLYPVYERQSY